MNALTGTGVLLRLALRRDRVVLPVWLYALTASIASTAFSFRSLYGRPEERLRFGAGIASNGSLRALYGPLHDAGTVGGLTAWRMGVLGSVLAALMSLLLVVRHTRAEEEDGRLELVGAGAVGRRAPLTAALLAAAVADLLLAGLVAACLVAAGQRPAGSLAFGLQLGACGMLFAGVAAVAAQVAGTARAANALAGTALGAAYVLRAVGDAGRHAAGLLSPLGWAEDVRPYAGDRWWMVALLGAVAAVAIGTAYVLVDRRDLGAGLLPQRPGPAAAAPGLRSAAALARRLQRASLAGWAIGLAVAGTVFGAVAKGVSDLVGGNAQVADVMARLGGRQGVLDAYAAALLTMFGMVAAGYAVQAVLRLRAEETSGRAEPVLAASVGRLGWAAGHLAYGLLGPAVLLAVAGAGLGLGEGAALGGPGAAVGRLVPAALAQLPAVWLTAGATVALLGLLPDRTAAGWGVLGAFSLVAWLGPVLRLPQAVLDLSPFTHVPHLPGGAVTAAPLLWTAALAAVCTAAGLAGLRRRDIG